MYQIIVADRKTKSVRRVKFKSKLEKKKKEQLNKDGIMGH
jgi:hypothetical protein